MTANGGFYVDDMSPQPNRPEERSPGPCGLLDHFQTRADCHLVNLDWAGGIVIAARHA